MKKEGQKGSFRNNTYFFLSVATAFLQSYFHHFFKKAPCIIHAFTVHTS